MSNLAIAAAHLVAIPARYAVGRWYNIPIATLLVFNATDLGLNILIRGIFENRKWKVSETQKWSVNFVSRALLCLTAMYVTSKIAQPIPADGAALTEIAGMVSVTVAVVIANMITGNK
jgi:hypothetical protein